MNPPFYLYKLVSGSYNICVEARKIGKLRFAEQMSGKQGIQTTNTSNLMIVLWEQMQYHV